MRSIKKFISLFLAAEIFLAGISGSGISSMAAENMSETAGTFEEMSEAGFTEPVSDETQVTENQGTENQNTEVTEAQNTEAQSTENQSTEVQGTEVQGTEAQSTEAQSTEAQSTEVQSTEAQSTEAQSSEVQSTEVQSTVNQGAQSQNRQAQETQTDGAADLGGNEAVTESDPEEMTDGGEEASEEMSEEAVSSQEQTEEEPVTEDMTESESETETETEDIEKSEYVIISLGNGNCSIKVRSACKEDEEVKVSIFADEGCHLTTVGAFELPDVSAFMTIDDPMEAVGEKVDIVNTKASDEGGIEISFIMPASSVLVMAQAEPDAAGFAGFGKVRMTQELKVSGNKADFRLNIDNLPKAYCEYPSKFMKSGMRAITTVKPYNFTLSDGTSYEMLAGYCLQSTYGYETYPTGVHGVQSMKTNGKYKDLIKALYLLSINPDKSMFSSAGLWGKSIMVNGEEVNLKDIFTGSGKGQANLTTEQAFAMAHSVVSKLYWLAEGSPSEWTWKGGGSNGYAIEGGADILNEDGKKFVDRIVGIIQDADIIEATIRKNGKDSSTFSADECTRGDGVLISPSFVWSTVPSNNINFKNLPAGVVIVDETAGTRGARVRGGNSFHVEAPLSYAGQDISLTAEASIFSGAGAFKSPGGEGFQDIGFCAVTNTEPVTLSGSFPLSVSKPIRIVKYDKETGQNAPQNKALTFAGAVYGVFADAGCTQQLCQVTIGSDGTGTSENLPVGVYYVKELTAPEGYELDASVYSVSITNNEVQVVTVNSAEQPKRGSLEIMKFLDKNTTASYLQKLYDEGTLEGISFTLTHEDPSVPVVQMNKTDRYGYTATADKALIYGTWTIHEDPATVPEGYQGMPDTTIEITGSTAVSRYVLTNREPQIPVRLTKRDAQTGKVIPIAHAKFQVLDKDGNPVKMRSNLDIAKLTDTFETNEEGQIVFYNYFSPGTYTFREIEAPEGYLRAPDQIITITNEAPVGEYFEVVFDDEPQRGALRIIKKDKDTLEPLDGCVFTVSAASDICDPSGELRKMTVDGEEKEISAGTVVAQLETVNGEALAEGLYPGEYIVKEIQAGDCYTPDQEEHRVTITADSSADILLEEITVLNKKTSIDLYKADSADPEHLMEGITFRVFSSEDVNAEKLRLMADALGEFRKTLAAEKEAFIGKQAADLELYKESLQDMSEEERQAALDTFSEQQEAEAITFEEGLNARLKEYEQKMAGELEVTDTSQLGREYVTDKEGHIHLEDLPHDTTWYIYEVKSLPGYNLDTTVYEFKIDENGFIDRKESAQLRVDNVPNVVLISKKDITGDKELPGAELTIRNSQGEVVESWVSTDTPHKIIGMSAGTYTLTEDRAPAGYATAETITFTVEDSLKVQEVTMYDRELTISVSKTDITNGKELPGASLEIKDSDGNTVEQWISGEEPHYVHLPAGTYTLTEIAAPDKYATAETITFEVKDDGNVQGVEMKDAPIQVEISKKDITTGDELPGAKLQITDSEGTLVEEWVSEKTPHMVSLSVGTYTLTEITAPDGYEKAVSIVFNVKDTAQLQKVEMLDEPEKPKKGKKETPEKTSVSGSKTAQGTGTAGDIKTGDTFRYLPSMILAAAGILLVITSIISGKKKKRD